MLGKFIFNENIKRVYNIIINSQIISQCILKDYISEVKIINDNKKKEKISENTSHIITNNSKSTTKYNDSSLNLLAINNLVSKANTSIHPITNTNNSFLYLNSSFKSLYLDKLEGLIIECKWKKKYILLLKISKNNDSQKNYKSIDIECIEMNHYENAFNLELSLYWNSSELQTIFLIKITPKDKIVEEIIEREFNTDDKKQIYNNMSDYLYNDLSNIEHCSTSLIFGNMKEISSYIGDVKRLITLSTGIENKRLEAYSSNLTSIGQNCRVYDKNTNQLCQEFIMTGYYVEKNKVCQIRWEKKVNNKIYCIYRLSIIYLEENISLMIFRNVWQTHISSQLLSEVDNLKKTLFEDVKNYFIKKNKLGKEKNILTKDISELYLNIAVKNYQNENNNNQIDLDMIIQNNSFLKHIDLNGRDKDPDNQYDSLFENNNSNNDIKEEENIFTDTIQNISEIQNLNSGFFFGIDEENNTKN